MGFFLFFTFFSRHHTYETRLLKILMSALYALLRKHMLLTNCLWISYFLLVLTLCTVDCGGMRWRSWLRHCATSWKVTGLIPDSVIGIFHWHNPSSCTKALGLTLSLREMSTRNISWRVKAASAYGWQPYDIHVQSVLKSGSLNLLEPSGPVQACNGIALPLQLNVSENFWSYLWQKSLMKMLFTWKK